MLFRSADAAAVAAIDASIDIARSAPPDTVAEAWQLHHWSPYVLHGAPRVRCGDTWRARSTRERTMRGGLCEAVLGRIAWDRRDSAERGANRPCGPLIEWKGLPRPRCLLVAAGAQNGREGGSVKLYERHHGIFTDHTHAISSAMQVCGMGPDHEG